MGNREELEIPTILFTEAQPLTGKSSTKCEGDDGNNTGITGDLGYGEENWR